MTEKEAATNPDVNREVPDPLIRGLVRLFVYGSLRRAEYNHARVNQWVPGEVLAHIADGYITDAALHNLGVYPALVVGDGQVTGEVYDVPQHLFNYINLMEIGAGYEGRPVLVWWETDRNFDGDANPLEALAYFYTGGVNPASRIPSGDWSLRSI